MNFMDLQTPFFRPLWRRVTLTAICFGWSVFEFVTDSPFFGIMFGALGLYCAHQFFIAFAPRNTD